MLKKRGNIKGEHHFLLSWVRLLFLTNLGTESRTGLSFSLFIFLSEVLGLQDPLEDVDSAALFRAAHHHRLSSNKLAGNERRPHQTAALASLSNCSQFNEL